MALQSLILLRHGQTAWNSELRMQGQRDIPISERGLAQARSAAASVAALRPDLLISSDLQRALATAQVMAEETGLPTRSDPRLRETNLGLWQGRTRDEVRENWPAEWAAWRHAGARVAPPGGEPRVAVAARAATVVDEIDAAETGTALLVTHGGLIVGLTARLLGLPEAEWGRFSGVGNCHWVVLHRNGVGWRLHTYNGGLGGIVLPGSDEEFVED